MAIRMTTSLSEINAMFDTGTKQIDSVTIQALANLGNECVTEARDRSQEESWFNQTGIFEALLVMSLLLMGRL